MTRLTALFIFTFLTINVSFACKPYMIKVQDEKGNAIANVKIIQHFKQDPAQGALQGASVVTTFEEDHLTWTEYFTGEAGWKEFLTDEEGIYDWGSSCAGVGNYPHTFVFEKAGYETLKVATNKWGLLPKDGEDTRLVILKKLPQLEVVTTSLSSLEFNKDEWVSVPVTAVNQQLTIFSQRNEGRVWLFDANGRLHQQEQLKEQVAFDVENLAVGHYYLRIESGTDSQTVKVLKL